VGLNLTILVVQVHFAIVLLVSSLVLSSLKGIVIYLIKINLDLVLIHLFKRPFHPFILSLQPQ